MRMLCRTRLLKNPAALHGPAALLARSLLASGSLPGALQMAVDDEKTIPPMLRVCTVPSSMTASPRPPLQHLTGPVIDLLMDPSEVKRTI